MSNFKSTLYKIIDSVNDWLDEFSEWHPILEAFLHVPFRYYKNYEGKYRWIHSYREFRWKLWYYGWRSKYTDGFVYRFLNYQLDLVAGPFSWDKSAHKELEQFNPSANTWVEYIRLLSVHAEDKYKNSWLYDYKIGNTKVIDKLTDFYSKYHALRGDDYYSIDSSFSYFNLNWGLSRANEYLYHYKPKFKKYLFLRWLTGTFSIRDFIKDFIKFDMLKSELAEWNSDYKYTYLNCSTSYRTAFSEKCERAIKLVDSINKDGE